VRSVNADGSVVCESARRQRDLPPAMRPWVLDLAPSRKATRLLRGIHGRTSGISYRITTRRTTRGSWCASISTPSPLRRHDVDLLTVDPLAAGFYGGFTDGRYGYLVPFENVVGKHGRVMRIDLQNFTTSGVAALNLQSIDPALQVLRRLHDALRLSGSLHQQHCQARTVVRIDLHDFTAAA